LPQQILWNKCHIRCAYFTPNCTWSPNYLVLVLNGFFYWVFLVWQFKCIYISMTTLKVVSQDSDWSVEKQ
jgi:hypothetical protein